MFLHSQDSSIKAEAVIAVTKSVIPTTAYTPVYHTVCVYLEDLQQPIVHTFETEEERDAMFNAFISSLDENNGHNN